MASAAEQGSASTREVLAQVAERLFAERGVHAVSNRHISEAAGQGNNTAISYHFGTKQDLIHAILQKHRESIDNIRGHLINDISNPSDLREWVTVAVRSITVHIQSLGPTSWYARFAAQIAADPAFYEINTDEMLQQSPSSLALHNGMQRCLPDLPTEVQTTRRDMTRHLITQTAVDHERALAENPGPETASWEDIAEELIGTIVALWQAPVEAEHIIPESGANHETTPRNESGIDQPTSLVKTAPTAGPVDAEMVEFIRRMRSEFTRFMMEYRFATDEMLTKVNILREEFLHLRQYNPIEHVTSRVKSAESILTKVDRRGIDPTLKAIRQNITDIAGIRITCSFVSDTYRVLDALTSQDDVHVFDIKDYIAQPKSNGYKSLHAIIQVPVFLSTGSVPVTVEVQIRTVAMDFWATLEHKIHYKYDGSVPEPLLAELTDAAAVAEDLDHKMEQLYTALPESPQWPDPETAGESAIDDAVLQQLWDLKRTSTGS